VACDLQLAERLRQALHAPVGDLSGIKEQPMFGGLSFMVGGNMSCGFAHQGLMVRVGSDLYQEALARDGTRQMAFTGRPLNAMVFVDLGVLDDAHLAGWVELTVSFAVGLPAK